MNPLLWLDKLDVANAGSKDAWKAYQEAVFRLVPLGEYVTTSPTGKRKTVHGYYRTHQDRWSEELFTIPKARNPQLGDEIRRHEMAHREKGFLVWELEKEIKETFGLSAADLVQAAKVLGVRK
jgi:hypothetical protein